MNRRGRLHPPLVATGSALANHVDGLDALNGSPRRVKRPKSLHGSYSAFDCEMVLFHHIVQIANGPTAAASTKFSSPLEFIDRARIGGIPVHVDDLWPRM